MDAPDLRSLSESEKGKVLSKIRIDHSILLSPEAISLGVRENYLIDAYYVDPWRLSKLDEIKDVVLKNIEIKRIAANSDSNGSSPKLTNILSRLPKDVGGNIMSYYDILSQKQLPSNVKGIESSRGSLGYWKGKVEIILGIRLPDTLDVNWMDLSVKVQESYDYNEYNIDNLTSMGLDLIIQPYLSIDPNNPLSKFVPDPDTEEYDIYLDAKNKIIKDNIPKSNIVFIGASALNHSSVMEFIYKIFTIDVNMYDSLPMELAIKGNDKSFKFLLSLPEVDLVKRNYLYLCITEHDKSEGMSNMLLDDSRYTPSFNISYLRACSIFGYYSLFKRLWDDTRLFKDKHAVFRTVSLPLSLVRHSKNFRFKENERLKIFKLCIDGMIKFITEQDIQSLIMGCCVNGFSKILTYVDEIGLLNVKYDKIISYTSWNTFNKKLIDTFKESNHPDAKLISSGRKQILRKYAEKSNPEAVADICLMSIDRKDETATSILIPYLLNYIDSLSSIDSFWMSMRNKLITSR